MLHAEFLKLRGKRLNWNDRVDFLVKEVRLRPPVIVEVGFRRPQRNLYAAHEVFEVQSAQAYRLCLPSPFRHCPRVRIANDAKRRHRIEVGNSFSERFVGEVVIRRDGRIVTLFVKTH